jgi:hypothetical protein
MVDHVRILGWLNIVLSVMGLSAILIVATVMGGVAAIFHYGVPEAHGFPVGGILAILMMVVTISVMVTALPGLIAGIGLLRFQNWARILAIVLAALHVLNFPLGTALAVYTFIVLLNPETAAAFERASRTGMP